MSGAARGPDTAVPSNGISDGGPPEQGPAMYAPKTARRAYRAPPELRTEPPWRLPGQPGAFTDDVAMAHLPSVLPTTRTVAELPTPAPPARMFGAKGMFLGVALIAGGVCGYWAGDALRFTAPEWSSSLAKAEYAILATGQVAETARAGTATPRLTVNAVRALRADEPAPLTISYIDAGPNVSVVIYGLPPGSAVEEGTPATPNAWRLVNTDLGRAVIRPPRGFVGFMDLTLELRLADDAIADRKSLQLEWLGKSAPAATASAEPSQRHLDASEIALLMKRGAELVANGNIGAARMMFQPAAEAGEPTAAFALAETYDPLVLERLGVQGLTSDIALAQRWYEKAKALGSTAAPESLATLTR
jgi:hypothetical protein